MRALIRNTVVFSVNFTDKYCIVLLRTDLDFDLLAFLEVSRDSFLIVFIGLN